METNNYKNLTVGQIVTEDFRAAEIFKKNGIDFCCGGQQNFVEACSEKSINIEKLENEIKELQEEKISQNLNFKEWDLGFLCDYIVNTHHKYMWKTLPELVFYTQKIAEVHGENHPELIEIANKVLKVNETLLDHLKREEEFLFPSIKEVLKTGSREKIELIKAEIDKMEEEHVNAGGAFDGFNVMTDGYKTPSDACNTYKVAFKLLEEFENDLHNHVHLENNILHIKAKQL